MARIRNSSLETPTARLRLPVRRKSYSQPLAKGIQLLYRRNLGQGAWSVKTKGWIKRIAAADDFEAANGGSVLNYDDAQDQARKLARIGEGNTSRLITVSEAIVDYRLDLKARGANLINASLIEYNLRGSPLLSKPVAMLRSAELKHWRNGMVAAGLKPASADRVGRSMKAALNLAALNDRRITNGAEWKNALGRLPNANVARDNVILPDAMVESLVRASHKEDRQVGLWIDLLAETGARESQAARLKVRDLQDSGDRPRIMMPCSRKGKNRQLGGHKPVSISSRLAALLRQAATGRHAHDPLIDPVYKLAERFRPVVKALGLGAEITPYSLRHSSIVRMLLKGAPIRVVASHHDTSVGEIERTYSRYITDVSDDLIRATLLPFKTEPTGNVVSIKR